jgi:preprotein translocase subunit YajC
LFTPAFAQAAGAPGGTDMLMQIVPFALIFVIMYVLIIRPQQKRAKEHQALIENVRRGDTVIMTGNVVLLQEKNVVKGEKLVIEHTTGHSTLYASPKAENGRVRGVFYPKQDSDAPAKPR